MCVYLCVCVTVPVPMCGRGLIDSVSFLYLQPDWKLADPICTFLFCILVLFSTINVLKDALRVLMEGTRSFYSTG